MKASIDPVKRDGKALTFSDSSVVVHFLFCVLILLPLWIVVLLPLAILSLGFSKLFSKPVVKESDSQSEIVEEFKREVPGSKREFDLVLYGATGFTGRLAALYLAKTYGKRFKWAIAGRRLDALKKIRDELCSVCADMKDLPIIIADSSDESSIRKMTSSTKVVITTAGPFDKYGSLIVKCCAEHGTHYGDITGESDWVRKMIDQYESLAKQTGAMIVHFCGHDCVPWDLAVLECSKALNANGDTLKEISIFDELNANLSGGTLATIFHSLENRVKYVSQLGFDPLVSKSGTMSSNKLTPKNQRFLGYSSLRKAWVGPFGMAMVMANCVRRSNAILSYGSSVTYSEALVYPSLMAGVANLIYTIVLFTCLIVPPLKIFLLKTVLPNPGEGPSKEAMDKDFLNLTGFAKGVKGSKVEIKFYFPTNPGYRDTARMLVESGLCMALQSDSLTCGGGVWTPAACLGSVLTKRLVDSGCELSIETNTSGDKEEKKKK